MTEDIKVEQVEIKSVDDLLKMVRGMVDKAREVTREQMREALALQTRGIAHMIVQNCDALPLLKSITPGIGGTNVFMVFEDDSAEYTITVGATLKAPVTPEPTFSTPRWDDIATGRTAPDKADETDAEGRCVFCGRVHENATTAEDINARYMPTDKAREREPQDENVKAPNVVTSDNDLVPKPEVWGGYGLKAE